MERVFSRGLQKGRVDDNSETVKKRLQLFHTKTTPLLLEFKEKVQIVNNWLIFNDKFK